MLKLIAKLQILHKIYSLFITWFPMFLVHNNAKFIAIKKILYNLWIDNIKGDCIEFGVFTGSSFRHTINVEYSLDKKSKTNFYGLDSFEGFPQSSHPFFKQFNYVADEKKVKKIMKINQNKIFIFKGYFNETLKSKELQDIKKFKFVHIDCDLYISALEPLDYIKTRLARGAYIMIDDFTNIDKKGNSIRKALYKEFQGHDFEIIGYFGVDGVIIRYFGVQ